MFSMVGYFNGNNQTLWVMFQGLFQTLLVRLPMSYYMSIQPAASLTKIGLAAPASTLVGILLNVIFFLYFNKKINNRQLVKKQSPTQSVKCTALGTYFVTGLFLLYPFCFLFSFRFFQKLLNTLDCNQHT